MYMYGGPLENTHTHTHTQHLHLYGSVALLNLGCECGVCFFNTLEGKIGWNSFFYKKLTI